MRIKQIVVAHILYVQDGILTRWFPDVMS